MSGMHNAKVMNRGALTRRLVACLDDEPVVGGIGHSNWDLWAAGPRPQNFHMLGSMGLAAPIALGLALARPGRTVFALEGDGSLLMQLGCLSTIAALAPPNLCVVLWDNGTYQITGAQPTPAARAGTDLVAVARACGIARSHWAGDESEFEALADAARLGGGPWFIGVRTDAEKPQAQTPREPVRLRHEFMRGLGTAR